jgi:16S rRNA (cytosine967-C5)-methyltransferase
MTSCMRIVWIIGGVSLFTLISAWSSPIRHQRLRSSLVFRKALRCTNGATVASNEWEEEARNTAATLLQSVFSPENATKVERAVKVALRSIDDGKLRQRVSQLVLGTSIMRKRHEYVYNKTLNPSKIVTKIRCMVDLHANYLNANDNDDDIITWPVDPAERIAVQYSMPDFLVQAWVEEYGVEETEALCTLSNKPGPITLRRNAIRCDSDDKLIQRLASEEGVELSPPSFAVPGCLRVTSGRPRSIWAMEAWRDGCFEVQDVGSQLIVAATDLAANDTTVVDYCAGNGGKTLTMLSQLHHLNSSSATVCAHDVEKMRLAQLRGSLSRAGVVNSTVRLFTTSQADEDLQDEMADAVLVDAPCSSCGVLRRRPSHRWELTQEALEKELPQLQLEILKNASRIVKPGGRLVYATCSVCRCENEGVAAQWEGDESIASSSWEPWPFPEDTWPIPPQSSSQPPHYCKVLPHKHDSDGFFIARWKRSKE